MTSRESNTSPCRSRPRHHVRLLHICVTHSVMRGWTASYENLWADWCGSVVRNLGRGLLQGATRVPTLGVWSALGQREHWLFCTRATASRLTLFNSTTQNRPTKHLLMAHGIPVRDATETGFQCDGPPIQPVPGSIVSVRGRTSKQQAAWRLWALAVNGSLAGGGKCGMRHT